jgi:hypothetical protein
MVRTTMTKNLLTDTGGLSRSDAKKVAPVDKKKIARFKNVDETPPLPSKWSSSSDTR